MNDDHSTASRLSRRRLLAGAAGAALGAGVLRPGTLTAQPAGAWQDTAARSDTGTVVFTHTTVVTNDEERSTLRDVGLAVENGRIAAIGDTDQVLADYPYADVAAATRRECAAAFLRPPAGGGDAAHRGPVQPVAWSS